jgi:hypothetical protein
MLDGVFFNMIGFREWGNLGHSILLVGTLENILETGRRLRGKSSPLVEVTHRRDSEDRFEWIVLYDHSGRLENSFHQPIPIRNIELTLKPSRSIKRITSLTNGKSLPRTKKSLNEMQTSLPRLRVFDVVLMEYEPQ